MKDMKAFVDHKLGSSCGPKIVALKHWLAKKGGARGEVERDDAGGAAAAGGKRLAGDSRRVKSEAIEDAARFLVMDAQPWSTVERSGFRYFSEQFGISTMTRKAVKDAFKRIYRPRTPSACASSTPTLSTSRSSMRSSRTSCRRRSTWATP